MKISRQKLAIGIEAAAIAPAWAQSFPSKPISMRFD